MQKILRDNPYTIGFLGLVGLGFITSIFQEMGGALSGVITQIGICGEGNSLCLAMFWITTLIFLLGFVLLIDFTRRHKRDLSLTAESITNQPIIRIWNYGNEDKFFSEINYAPYGWSGSDSDVGTFTDVEIDRKEGRYYDTLYVEVFNNPERISGIPTAIDVRSSIEWYNADESALIHQHYGRWFIPSPNLEKNKERLLYKDINSNGDPQKLHFAIKNKSEKRFFGLCRDRGDSGIIRDDRYKLTDEKYIVKIKLTGSNCFQEFKYRVERKNTKFSITEALTDESIKHKQE